MDKPSASKGEPPSKKRKTETFDDDSEWDDDFTAAELDDITDTEIRASQVSISKPSTSHPISNTTFEERETFDTFFKPPLSRSSSSVGSHSNSATSRLSRSSFNQSNNSAHHTSSDSSYPADLSGYSGTSSYSILSSSGDQVSGLRRPSYKSNGSSSDSDTPLAVDEINRMKQEYAQLKQKVTKLNEELCAKDGENKLLRDNLVKKGGELDSLKSEKVNLIYQQNKQQTEKEKQFQTDVTRLQTQLQFKEQDERELSNRVKELEIQISSLQTAPTASQTFPNQPSPKPLKVIVKDISPEKPAKSGFPTKRTFMATEGSPKKLMKLFEETPSTSTPQQKSAVVTKIPENKLKLKTKVWRRSRECQLVSKLLDVSPCVNGQSDYRSIVGLLSTQWISSSLQNIQFDRDKDTSLLSPIKRRLSDVNMLLNQSGKEANLIRLVNPDHFNLAIKGLKHLLSAPDTSLSQTGSRSHMTLLDLDLSQHSDSSMDEQADKVQRISSSLGKSTLDSAIMLLPMLQNYLQHYIEMLETSVEPIGSASGISNSSSSESFESSLESPTGSLGILLRSTATYANNLESLGIAALKTLCTLVNYECVRKVLYYSEDSDSEFSETSVDSVTTSTHNAHLPVKMILKLRLLPKVIRLASSHTKGQLSNKEVVESSLTILEILARHSQGSDVHSLLSVMTDDVLQHCVENEEEPSFVIHGLMLFKALCKSKLVVSTLCSNATGCVLLSIYTIGIGRKSYIERGNHDTLTIIKLVIESIFYIACSHKGGILILMDSDCQCSAEVVKCIVILLYRVMKIYRQHRKGHRVTEIRNITTENQTENVLGTCLDILENGLLLLHLMSQHDQEFVSRHEPAQHYYVMLICGMSQIVKLFPADKCESALTAIQDLWDFNQDDSELSPDSDTDMNEDRE